LICDGCAERLAVGRRPDRAGASAFGNASPQFVTSIAATVAAIAAVAIHFVVCGTGDQPRAELAQGST
jgi:hypothetical protein